MSDAEPDPEPVDTTDATDAELLVADPDDYHESQRLREIHDARQDVADQIRDLDIDENHGASVYRYSVTELAHSTALYVMELLPLMHQTGVDPADYTLPDTSEHDHIAEFAHSMGMRGEKPADQYTCMAVYRQCNQFLAEMKPLIEEEDTDEWEV